MRRLLLAVGEWIRGNSSSEPTVGGDRHAGVAAVKRRHLVKHIGREVYQLPRFEFQFHRRERVGTLQVSVRGIQKSIGPRPDIEESQQTAVRMTRNALAGTHAVHTGPRSHRMTV